MLCTINLPSRVKFMFQSITMKQFNGNNFSQNCCAVSCRAVPHNNIHMNHKPNHPNHSDPARLVSAQFDWNLPRAFYTNPLLKSTDNKSSIDSTLPFSGIEGIRATVYQRLSSLILFTQPTEWCCRRLRTIVWLFLHQFCNWCGNGRWCAHSIQSMTHRNSSNRFAST